MYESTLFLKKEVERRYLVDGFNINRYDKAANSYMNSQLSGSVIAARKSLLGKPVTNDSNGSSNSHNENNHFEGEIIKGEVVDLKNNEVTVKTETGEVINAKVKDASSLYIGQKVDFKTSTIGGKLYLEPVMSGAEQSVNSIIQKALEAATLPQNPKNIAIAQALLNNNMSVDKQSIMKIISQTYTNKNASIDTIVLMNKHNIPIKNDNAAQFENYRNYEHRMIKELGEIATTVPEVFDKVTSGYQLVDVNHEVIQILSSGPQPLKSPVPLASSAFTSASDKEMLLSVLGNFEIDAEVMEGIKGGWARLDEVALAINDAYEQAKQMDTSRAGYLSDFSSATGMVSARALFENPVITTILEKNATFTRNSSVLSSFLSQEQLDNIQNVLKEIKSLPGGEGLANDVAEGKITAFEFMERLDSVLETADAAVALKTLKMPEYKDIIREAIISKWTITSDNVADPKEVENTYERIYEQTERLSNLAGKTFGESETQIAKHSSNVKNNINFMETLNDMFSYIQLPVKLANQNIHSELFVMTDKKKLAANKDNISVLLRLEMEHLGLIDVNIKKSGNVVDAVFKLPNKMDVDLFKTNMEHLEYALLEKGFLLNATAEHKVEEMDIVKDFIEKDSSDVLMKRYTFDIRA